jgi:hypothetical protein
MYLLLSLKAQKKLITIDVIAKVANMSKVVSSIVNGVYLKVATF